MEKLSLTPLAAEEVALDEVVKYLWESLLANAPGIFVGGLITWLVAWFYYETATKDLKTEAKHLRSTSNLILLALENGGLKVVINRDASGNAVSVAGQLSANLSGTSKFEAKMSDGSSQS